MMQFTEEQRKALIEHAKYLQSVRGGTAQTRSLIEIALAALTAKEEPCEDCGGSGIAEEPSDDGLGCVCCACCGTGKSELYKSPPVAALKLPDEKSTDIDYAYYPLTKARHEGWNACLAEVKRLNATASAEGEE